MEGVVSCVRAFKSYPESIMYLLKLSQKNTSHLSLLRTTPPFQTLPSYKKFLYVDKTFIKGWVLCKTGSWLALNRQPHQETAVFYINVLIEI